MPESLIQTYLTQQHISTDDDDAKAKLSKAVTTIVASLRKKKRKIPAYTLVGLDPFVPEDNSALVEIEKILTKSWPVFKNSIGRTKDKPTIYTRLVILEALARLSKEIEFASIIWHSGRNYIEHVKLSKEADSIGYFFTTIGNRIELEALSHWGNTVSIDLPEIKFEESDSLKISKAPLNYLKKHMSYSAGPVTTEADVVKNKHWTNQNAAWANEFGNIAGQVIAASIDVVADSSNKAVQSLDRKIEGYIQNDVAEYLRKISLVTVQQASTINQKSQLLWWKEALYSPTLKSSYRQCNDFVCAISMAIDLLDLVDPIYPVSVDYLYREALSMAASLEASSEKKTFKEWLDIASRLEASEKQALFEHLPSINNDERKPLLFCVVDVLTDSAINLASATGLKSNDTISLADFGLWIFHDLQANKSAITK